MKRPKAKPISVGDRVVVRDDGYSRLLEIVGHRGVIIEVCEAGYEYHVRLDERGEAYLPDRIICKVPAGIS